MSQPVDSAPFHALARELRAGGFVAHAERLDRVLDGAWTTSSEMIGELGQVVVAVRRECRPPTPARKALVRDCLKEVRKAWPGFALFSGLPRIRTPSTP